MEQHASSAMRTEAQRKTADGGPVHGRGVGTEGGPNCGPREHARGRATTSGTGRQSRTELEGPHPQGRGGCQDCEAEPALSERQANARRAATAGAEPERGRGFMYRS